MQRKLTAILSADVVGYSGLMEADEAGTLERLKANRAAIFDPLVSTNGGRVFKLLGDGALAEFPSVVSAVACALAIQEATARGEPGVAPEKRIRYRIGVNLGDIMIDGDDIYGEGVNVAARLQTLAPTGGVAVSRTVRDHMEGKVACSFEDLGEHQVKDHERPVHAFCVRPSVTEKSSGVRVGERLKPSVCVLPFVNMSGDIEQEYFSDGISEDIITDLSKVSALEVIARNTSFQFKGKNVDVVQVARQLKVSHVLEGSVRKAGGRVRITAQLIDGGTGNHVWAERYDRDLNDIFALQDEISEAIVKALKLRLLPEEKNAIERRGTENVEAYNHYLMARQYWTTGNVGDSRREEAIIRLCAKATEIDPNYARAWALMAFAQRTLRYYRGKEGDGGREAAERALSLDATLAEPHAVKAGNLEDQGQRDAASAELALALRLDPESDLVNRIAATLSLRWGKLEDAIRYFEKAAALTEADYGSAMMLITCFAAIDNREGLRRAARMGLERAEKALTRDQNNGNAMAAAAMSLAVLGEAERAKEWANRALLIDPENMLVRYNLACSLSNHLKDIDAAIDLLGPVFATISIGFLKVAQTDPDLNPLRADARFKAMLAAAEARLNSDMPGSPPAS